MCLFRLKKKNTLIIIWFLFSISSSENCLQEPPHSCPAEFYPGAVKKFKIPYDPQTEWLFILSNSTKVVMGTIGRNGTFWEQEHFSVKGRNERFMLITPGNPITCEKAHDCYVIIAVQSESDFRMWVQLTRVHRPLLQDGVIYSNSINYLVKEQFGFHVEEKDLPVLISLVPDVNKKGCDADLFLYGSKNPSSAFFPNIHQSRQTNHLYNARESAIIAKDDLNNYWRFGDFYIIEVYGSSDASESVLHYQLGVQTNYKTTPYDPYSIPQFMTSVLVFMTFGTIACCTSIYRAQWSNLLARRIRQVILGATKAELNTLQLATFESDNTALSEEDQSCVICLENYEENDQIRILRCGHCFHQGCVDTWLNKKKTCPLCAQEIMSAANCHGGEIPLNGNHREDENYSENKQESDTET